MSVTFLAALMSRMGWTTRVPVWEFVLGILFVVSLRAIRLIAGKPFLPAAVDRAVAWVVYATGIAVISSVMLYFLWTVTVDIAGGHYLATIILRALILVFCVAVV